MYIIVYYISRRDPVPGAPSRLCMHVLFFCSKIMFDDNEIKDLDKFFYIVFLELNFIQAILTENQHLQD
jgi:hypothetical protein